MRDSSQVDPTIFDDFVNGRLRGNNLPEDTSGRNRYNIYCESKREDNYYLQSEIDGMLKANDKIVKSKIF